MAQPQQAAEAPRKDPRPRRRIPGMSGTVKERRPDREYVFANPNDHLFGLSRHIDDGWTKINKDRDKERAYAGRVEENGDVSFEGQILLWIDKAEYQEMLDDAQAIVKARDAKAKRPGGIDSVVGVNGKLAADIDQ